MSWATYNRSGLLTAKILSSADMGAPGGRWDPKASFLADFLRGQYEPLLPAVVKLKESLVSDPVQVADNH